MRTILSAGLTSLALNLFILSILIPLAIGFQPAIVLQIAFWTFFAAAGASVTMLVLQKLITDPTYIFITLACTVFVVSLIPIYLHFGILNDFPPSLGMAAVWALVVMHIVDSLTISLFVLRLAHRPNSKVTMPAGSTSQVA